MQIDKCAVSDLCLPGAPEVKLLPNGDNVPVPVSVTNLRQYVDRVGVYILVTGVEKQVRSRSCDWMCASGLVRVGFDVGMGGCRCGILWITLNELCHMNELDTLSSI